MTVELLTLVALWCGAPLEGHSYKTDTSYIGPVISTQDVTQCRKDLIGCIRQADLKFGVAQGTTVNQVVAENQCFEKRSYPGRDQQ